MLNIKSFWEGIKIVAKTVLGSDTKGELEVLDSDGKIYYHNGATRSPIVTEEHAGELKNKIISADLNTISDLEVDNLKTGVLNIDLANSTPTDAEIPSAKATKDYADQVAGEVQQDVDDLITLTGVPANSTDLGTFTGTDIPDNSTVKGALQALETEKINGSGTANRIPIFTGNKTLGNSGLTMPNEYTITPANPSNNLVLDTLNTLAFYSSNIQMNGGVSQGPITALIDPSQSTNIRVINTRNARINDPAITTIGSVTYGVNGSLAPVNGQEVVLFNNNITDILIKNETSAYPINKIKTGTGRDVKLKPSQAVYLIYSTEQAAWIIVGGSGSGASGTLTFTAGQILVRGQLVYISKGTGSDSARTAGRLYLADASNDDRIEVVGIVDSAGSAGSQVDVIVSGTVFDLIGLTSGSMYYLSTTSAGSMTINPPSQDGQWVVPLGVAADSSTFILNSTPSASAQYISGNERTYTILNNQMVAQNISGLVIDPSQYRGGTVTLSIRRKTSTGEVCDNREVKFSYNESKGKFSLAEHYSGDDTGIEIFIQPSGQFSYTSSNMSGTGYVGDMKLYINKLFTR